ncbi:hypothetical protein NDN08_003460 [Rhodosorus marinus]|uniref:60S acidic ribosomal protein P2 n=1 Tax=Rhodosorus marinus TaxID=101924 RepID=A0AAV8V086_9RHOD|nr:hypothetical protein NDN08_003460 [Rhodosorus marinus]
MKYLGAYMLATLGGNSDPSPADMEAILGSVGIEGDKDIIAKICEELKGKNVDDLIAAGKEKFAKTAAVAAVAAPAGGAAPTAAGGNAAAAPAAEAEAEKEEEEEDEDMGFSLFD